jgi:hypothetical protein
MKYATAILPDRMKHRTGKRPSASKNADQLDQPLNPHQRHERRLTVRGRREAQQFRAAVLQEEQGNDDTNNAQHLWRIFFHSIQIHGRLPRQ